MVTLWEEEKKDGFGYRRRIEGLFTVPHGGECCGIYHLNNFPCSEQIIGLTLDQKIEFVKEAVRNAVNDYDHGDDECDCNCENCYCVDRSLDSRNDWSMGIEVVLVDSQFPVWKEAIEKVGFKEVISFHNSNSGNTCHVFYLITGDNNEQFDAKDAKNSKATGIQVDGKAEVRVNDRGVPA